MPLAEILAGAGPILALFAAGLAARGLGIAGAPAGLALLNVVTYAGLPLLFLGTVSRTSLDARAAWLPLIACAVIVGTWPLARLLARALRLPRASEGSFVVSTLSMNVSLEMPFVFALGGPAAISALALFDLGHALTVFTLASALAARYGGGAPDVGATLRRVLAFPPLVALAAALALNVGGVHLPDALYGAFAEAGRWLVMLVALALGILFDARRLASAPVAWILAVRIGAGALIALGLVAVLDIEPPSRDIALLGAAAPVGFTATVLAARERLDVALAASATSLSVLAGLVYIPLCLALMR